MNNLHVKNIKIEAHAGILNAADEERTCAIIPTKSVYFMSFCIMVSLQIAALEVFYKYIATTPPPYAFELLGALLIMSSFSYNYISNAVTLIYNRLIKD